MTNTDLCVEAYDEDRLICVSTHTTKTNLCVEAHDEECEEEDGRPDGAAGQHGQRLRVDDERQSWP